MGYWGKRYGERSNDFIEGVIAGVEAYAIWRGGGQYVGVKEQPLKEAIAEIKKELGWKED